MRYRTLGRTGLSVSEVGIGGAPLGGENYIEKWSTTDTESVRSVHDMFYRALDLGYNYVDTAASYGNGRSEELIGESLEGGLRERVVLATKTAWNLDKDGIVQSVEASLRRLRTDRVDVIQLHGDTGYAYTLDDYQWIMDGPMQALQDLKDQGKVRFIGITCEEPTSLRPFIETDLFDVIQIKYNAINQGPFFNAIPMAKERNLGVVVMRPLTSGILQKLMRKARPDIESFIDLNELALNFVLSDPVVSTAIVGMRRSYEAERNNEISDDERKRIDVAWLQDRRA